MNSKRKLPTSKTEILNRHINIISDMKYGSKKRNLEYAQKSRGRQTRMFVIKETVKQKNKRHGLFDTETTIETKREMSHAPSEVKEESGKSTAVGINLNPIGVQGSLLRARKTRLKFPTDDHKKPKGVEYV